MIRKIAGSALGAAILAMAVLMAPQQAHANRANDTLNIAETLPLGSLDLYYGTYPHTQFMSNMIFDTLVNYDPVTKTIVPLLASSFKEIGDTTLEFTLRTDVKWHDGKPFTADDVVYTIGWLIDPKSRYFKKFRWEWIKGVKKTGPNTVQIETAPRRPYDLLLLSSAPIYPKHIREGMTDNMAEFGRKPIGTGPYKVQEFSEAQGRLVVVKNPGYPMGGPTKSAANFGKVVLRSIPDQGAQISSLMVGEVDMFRGLPADQAEALAKDPRFALTVNPSIGLTFMWFDTVGKGGNKALLDIKVRQAMSLAINRKNIEKIVNGNQKLQAPENLCWKDRMLGCSYNLTAPDYDPKKAKQLLAQAGYANGLTVRISSYVGRLSQLAEAVAGDLAAIGVKASVEPLTVSTFTKKAQAGQIQMTVAGNSLGGLPDVSELFNYFFLVYDMTGDAEILKQGALLDLERDTEKRKLISAKIFDRIMEKSYILPLTSQPQFFVHSKEVELGNNSSNSYGIDISRIRWKSK